MLTLISMIKRRGGSSVGAGGAHDNCGRAVCNTSFCRTVPYARYLNDDAQPSSLAALYRQRVNRAYFELLLDLSISQTVAVFDKDVSTRGGEIRVLRLRDSARDATRRDEDPER